MSPAREAAAVVVGGGIWGCAIAYHLARAGLRDVVVLERRELACGNTPQAAGLVGQLRSTELMVRSIRRVVARLERWAAEHGEECGFRQVGSLKLALTEPRVKELEEHVAHAREWGLEVELISPAAARARVPLLDAAGVRAAAWIPGDGYVEPYTLAMAIARAARRLGVRFETERPVTAIRIERGAVRGVDTPAGPLDAPRVVVAAGPWVERVAEAVGLRVDTVPLRHQHWTTAPMAEVPPDLPVVRVPDASVYIRPEVGGLMLGGFEARPRAFSMAELPLTFEIEHTEKDLGVLEELAGGLTRAFPGLAGAPVLKGCAGLPTFTPDGNYLIGAAPGVDGLWVAAGCNAIGIAGSLLIGEWMGELVVEGRTRDDTATQSLTRFGARYADRRRLREACESIYGHFYSLDQGAF
ncbi:MAG TPA: FAD-dependent oxidoreductase [Methylomirabilota bacterium]|nr:FAD-dependent oxidoreductase [Methylomirabilota bacterium]